MDRVREFLAHLRLHRLIALEVGEREWPPFALCQLQAIAARVAGEVVGARERRADARVFASIEETNRIRGVIGLDAVNRLVDDREADLRANRLAGLIGDRDMEHAWLARPRYRLLRGDRDIQGARCRRDPEPALGAIQPSLAQVDDVHENIADVTLVDRDLYRIGGAWAAARGTTTRAGLLS